MTKPYLPHVTLETLQETAQRAQQNLDALFTEMATANPELYRFAYGFHERPETTKTTMLGVIAGMYVALEAEGQKQRKDRRRLKHSDSQKGAA